MTNEQLELGLGGTTLGSASRRRESRIQRAAWWFDQMRQIVDRAMDWQPAVEPRPEQTWLPGARREIQV